MELPNTPADMWRAAVTLRWRAPRDRQMAHGVVVTILLARGRSRCWARVTSLQSLDCRGFRSTRDRFQPVADRPRRGPPGHLVAAILGGKRASAPPTRWIGPVSNEPRFAIKLAGGGSGSGVGKRLSHHRKEPKWPKNGIDSQARAARRGRLQEGSEDSARRRARRTVQRGQRGAPKDDDEVGRVSEDRRSCPRDREGQSATASRRRTFRR